MKTHKIEGIRHTWDDKNSKDCPWCKEFIQ